MYLTAYSALHVTVHLILSLSLPPPVSLHRCPSSPHPLRARSNSNSPSISRTSERIFENTLRRARNRGRVGITTSTKWMRRWGTTMHGVDLATSFRRRTSSLLRTAVAARLTAGACSAISSRDHAHHDDQTNDRRRAGGQGHWPRQTCIWHQHSALPPTTQ